MAGCKRGAILVGSMMLATILAGCSGNGGSGTDVPLDNFTAEQIYQRGEYELETNRKPKDAAHYFSEIERLYPYTEWAKRALVMEAYSFHQARDYENARGAAQRFVDLYPGDQDAAYAQYLLALSYYDQIEAVGRDQGLTFQALQSLRDVIEKYPDSEYAKSAMMKFDLAFDHLAAKEMEIGRFYLSRGHYTAAINRFRVVVEDYQTTTYTPEALHRLVEAYLALGFENEAVTAAAILGHNFQSSPFYQDSYALLKGRGLEPEERGDSWLSRIYRQTIRGEWL
ncbi:outer membrane protein assembly factor BamD [Haematobacter massiliensis]|uniref:Outer membrane protein assembly factor BamD n=1 Tax=Haematobacter massiliensis TaxID=195105 RepID=A0A086YB26_9RHOB|nr:outer membrane protein assembly factor BamD [Haematobacter massiliensis]KFI31476.1 competence protein ComL [Haematobacter massiliensis]OWJ71727.1 outer membrane protein assembly factor BamD [Haematobacter massiliensis]OWJ88163.1 outer membrane protein assembly factor BamD [Haematobacter massiliensis]QBJ25271.1 outer membrane protein assembly factor BamD [Haematobacter massiliensis]